MGRTRQNRPNKPPEAPKAVALLVPIETAQAIMNHLTSRPYSDVFQLVSALQQAAPVNEDQLAAMQDAAQPEDDSPEE